MYIGFLKLHLEKLVFVLLVAFIEISYGAVGQCLNEIFYQNPAELSMIDHTQVLAGNVFITPKYQFTGSAPGGVGKVSSKASNNLPYVLGAYRLTSRFVMGINFTPTNYGHIKWPIDSIVSELSTTTNLLFYRSGVQSSYQLNDKLALGAGVNLEIIKLEEVDFVVPNLGNQINKDSGLTYSLDAGLSYNINPRHSLTVTAYSPVSITGSGTSSLNGTVSRSYRLGATNAAVVYVGLQHVLSDKWTFGEKVYWSGWSIQKNLNFVNTATGSFTVPTNWQNSWSFQATTRYVTTEKVALLGSAIYETNPNPTLTNSIGYPLAPFTFFTAGLDLNLVRSLSSQIIYSYGLFTPKAKIDNQYSRGLISANIQAVVLQFTYKI